MTNQNYRVPLAFLTLSFFMWGFITCLNDIMIPHLKELFSLNYVEAMVVQFTFFGTFAIVSIPMAKVIQKIGHKKGIVTGFMVIALGCLIFLPAAAYASYGMFIFGYFIMATGVTTLQVACNPYATLLGKPETASSRLTFMQAFNSLGTTIAPFFGGILILVAGATATTVAGKVWAVQKPFIILAVALVLVGLLFAFVKLPKIDTNKSKDDSSSTVNALEDRGSIWKYKHLILGCVAIFMYVGAEVSIGSFLINYFELPELGAITGLTAASYVGYYWGGAMVGRFIGTYLLKEFAPNKIIALFSSIAIVLVVISMLTNGNIAVITIVAVGLFNSIQFPTIFSVALRGLGKYTAIGSGLLIVSIVGGAIVPIIQGSVADTVGVHHAFIIPVICYLYIVFYGLKGYDKSVFLTSK